MAAPVKEKLAGLRHVALDLDGTIYRGGSLFPESLPFLALLEELGIEYSFLTNNSSRGVRDYVHHLSEMGVKAGAERVLISTQAAVRHFRKNLPSIKKLFVVGTAGMMEDLSDAGFICDSETPEAVVVGFDPELSYSRLCEGAWWIKSGLPFIATHPDRVCPTDARTILVDCGSICAALKEATGREPDAVTGKPEACMLETVFDAHSLAPSQLAMVGDRLYTDMAMAHRVGAISVLVLTGETTASEAAAARPRPEIIAKNLAEFGVLIRAAREEASLSGQISSTKADSLAQ
jgi:HAD superfamily hydrolase (TIGR01450 family)